MTDETEPEVEEGKVPEEDLEAVKAEWEAESQGVLAGIPEGDEEVEEEEEPDAELSGTDYADAERYLSTAVGLSTSEEVFMSMYTDVLWSDDPDRRLVAYSQSQIPQAVLAQLSRAVDKAFFNDIEADNADVAAIKREFKDALETGESWSIKELTERVLDVTDMEPSRAETIVRTELQATVNEARKQYYLALEEAAHEQFLFKWLGPKDHRTTETCKEITTKSRRGLRLSELIEVIENVARKHGHEPREFTPHINCRHTYARVV